MGQGLLFISWSERDEFSGEAQCLQSQQKYRRGHKNIQNDYLNPLPKRPT